MKGREEIQGQLRQSICHRNPWVTCSYSVAGSSFSTTWKCEASSNS